MKNAAVWLQHHCSVGTTAGAAGAAVLQVLCPRGTSFPPGVVEGAAAAAGLQLRTGCNCNPGVCLQNLGITPEEVSCYVWLL
jgi:hypothetical protein